jgi:demethoxyubiquinone hydroxylase (CLK1/Coq7/Cat5 family)
MLPCAHGAIAGRQAQEQLFCVHLSVHLKKLHNTSPQQAKTIKCFKVAQSAHVNWTRTAMQPSATEWRQVRV